MPLDKQQEYSLKQVEILSNLPDIDHEPRFRVKVIANTKITKDIITLSLERPTEFIFIPSQYIWLVLPECSKYSGIIDRRAYSISSAIGSKTIDLIINLTESDFLKKVKALKVGEEVDIIGPMGSAFIVPPTGAIMIAGGTGISPFLSILRSHMVDNLSLIAYSSREKGSLHFEDELKELSNKYGYKIDCIKTNPQASDLSHITRKEHKEPILICGSQGFVNFITDTLIENGVAPSRLHYEENHPQTEAGKKLKDMFINFFYGDYSNSPQNFSGLSDLFLQATKQTSNHVILTDHDGHILFANQASIDMTGYTFAEMQGQTPRLWGGLMSSLGYHKLWASIKKGTSVKKVIINRRRDGSIYTAIATITPILHKGIYMATEENITTLRQIDKAKTEFISIASHQLRTPLSVVNWYAEMLLSGDTGKLTEQQSKYLQEIYAGNQRMVELVNSLLDISRLELGTFVVKPEPTNIVELTQTMISEQKVKIDEKKINFSFESEKHIPILQADPKLLRMIIQNLLSNAIKYTPDKGNVSISLSINNKDSVLITVSDTGFGIPDNQKDKIFGKFFRADNVRLKSTEGTGLGLYIVKSIAESSGGKIWFESQENQGSTFYVSIPIDPIINKEGQEIQ